jgi:predicted permease
VRQGFGPEALKSSLAATAAAFRQSGKGARNHAGLQAFSLQDSIVGDVRLKLLLLFGVVAAMLLIACLNLAGLLLARLAARQREVAVRLALGSGAARLVAQFAVENALLIAAGCAAGVVLARWLLQGLVALVPFALPSSQPIRLDWQTLAFAIGLAALMALTFSLAPLFTARRIAVYEALKAGRGSSGAGPARLATRGILVVSEVALSAVLLVSAVLLMQSLYRLNSEPLGFSPRGVLAFSTPRERYRNPAAQRAFQEQLLTRLAGLPGISAAGVVDHLPLTGHANLPTALVGHPDLDIGGMEIRTVSPGFFTALRIPLLRGRAIQASDTAGSAPVIVVNEAVARRWWPQGNALDGLVNVGRFHGRDFTDGAEAPRQVVGVVADVKTEFLNAPARPTVYLPIAQTPWMDGGVSWVVRADRLDGLGDRLRAVVAEIDGRQRVTGMREMPDIVSATTRDSRFDAWLFGLFAALALALAALGIYGLLAFSVARRTNEFGIRMALGANRGSVLRIVLRQGVMFIGIGLALGFAAAYAATRFLASLLYGVKPHDPVSFAAVALVLFAAGLAASYLPARRATRVDPMTALRYE